MDFVALDRILMLSFAIQHRGVVGTQRKPRSPLLPSKHTVEPCEKEESVRARRPLKEFPGGWRSEACCHSSRHRRLPKGTNQKWKENAFSPEGRQQTRPHGPNPEFCHQTTEFG